MMTSQIKASFAESIGRLGFGALHLSILPRPSTEAAIAVIHTALRSGITLIDTADSYCMDESDRHHNELLVRRALQTYEGKKKSVIVATKGGMTRSGGQWLTCGDPVHLEKAIMGSFSALGGDKPIDIWQLHAPDPVVDLAESLRPARLAVQRGILRSVGLCNVSVDQIKRARDIVDVVSVQNQYSLWNRTAEFDGVIEYCDRENILFLAWSPLGGRLRHQDLHRVPFLLALAHEKNASVYAIVLAWMMGKSDKIVPIPGTANQDHIQAWLRATEINLSAADVFRIGASFYMSRSTLPGNLAAVGRRFLQCC
jgi:pyridoxine 4-dehydrogenase